MTAVSQNRGFGVLALVLAASVAGCQTSALDEFAPQPGVRNTGAFPDLNVAKQGETAQLTTAETSQKVAELKAAQASAASQGGGAPVANAAEFRQAQQNQRKTLEEIEGE